MAIREVITQLVSDRAGRLLEDRVRNIVTDMFHEQDLAPAGEVEALRLRVQELEQRVERLAERLATLEHHAEQATLAAAEEKAEVARPAASPTPAVPQPAGQAVCQVPGCGGVYRSKGFCSSHYQRWRRGTLPGYVRTDGTVQDGTRRWKVGVEHAGAPVEITGPEGARVLLVHGKPVAARAV